MKVVLWLLLLLALAGGGYYWASQRDADDETASEKAESTFVVRKGPLKITITESGTFKAEKSESINSKLQRGGTIAWLVDEGNEVKAGDVLARFEDTDLKRELEDLESNIIEAQTQVETARKDLSIQIQDNETAIAKAELDLDNKQVDVIQYLEVTHKGTTKELADSVRRSELDYQRALERWQRSKELREKDFVTEEELKRDEIEEIRTSMAFEKATRDQNVYHKYTYPKDKKQKEFAENEAERALARSKARADSQKSQRESVLQQRERRFKHIEGRIEKKKEELANTVVKSPLNGIVIYGQPARHWDRENIKVGGRIWGGFTLFTIPDLNTMQVILNVHEVDINKITEGLETITTCDTYPDLKIPGRITKIASLANASQGWQRSTVKEFMVTVTLDGENLGIEPGITARTEILIDQLDDVVQVPVQAVFSEEGNHFCFAPEGNEFVQRRVKIGQANDLFAEITEGLSEGESVLLYRPDSYRQADMDSVSDVDIVDGDTDTKRSAEPAKVADAASPEKKTLEEGTPEPASYQDAGEGS